MTHTNRIVTRMEKSPTTDFRHREWLVRIVFYDEATPLYTAMLPFERKYRSLAELLKYNHRAKEVIDKPVLDLDNYLQTYDTDEVRTCRQGL
jgi:hypothetical protein